MYIPWLCLAGAVIAEIGMVACIKASEGWTKLWPTVGLFGCGVVSIYLLSQAAKTIPISTAYAIWTGLGAVGAATLGMAFYAEPASALKVLCIACILGGVVGLKLLS